MSNPENKEQITEKENNQLNNTAVTEVKETPKKNQKVDKKDKKKEKKPKERKVSRKVKETTSELKKVSWLSFGQVCKRTVIVIGFVLISTLILFGVDQLLQWVYKLIVNNVI